MERGGRGRAFDLFFYTHLFPNFVLCVRFFSRSSSCRAVVWADFIQFVLMMFAIVTVVMLGANNVGGFANVWSAAERGSRLIIFK